MNRRSFLQTASAVLMLQASRSFALALSPLRGFGANPFTLGVASGDLAPDGFVLWTRLAVDPTRGDGGMPPTAVPVRWEIASDPAMKIVVKRGTAAANRAASGLDGCPSPEHPSR